LRRAPTFFVKLAEVEHGFGIFSVDRCAKKYGLTVAQIGQQVWHPEVCAVLHCSAPIVSGCSARMNREQRRAAAKSSSPRRAVIGIAGNKTTGANAPTRKPQQGRLI
jgi:hypothetical protein